MRWTHDLDGIPLFQPGDRRILPVPAVAQAAASAHASFIPTVCEQVPDQLPMKLSMGQVFASTREDEGEAETVTGTKETKMGPE
jgi:hypothetical protein